jgi:hypothetical protein
MSGGSTLQLGRDSFVAETARVQVLLAKGLRLAVASGLLSAGNNWQAPEMVMQYPPFHIGLTACERARANLHHLAARDSIFKKTPCSRLG